MTVGDLISRNLTKRNNTCAQKTDEQDGKAGQLVQKRAGRGASSGPSRHIHHLSTGYAGGRKTMKQACRIFAGKAHYRSLFGKAQGKTGKKYKFVDYVPVLC